MHATRTVVYLTVYMDACISCKVRRAQATTEMEQCPRCWPVSSRDAPGGGEGATSRPKTAAQRRKVDRVVVKQSTVRVSGTSIELGATLCRRHPRANLLFR